MLFLSVLVAHAALPVVPLPKLNIDPKTITVSGISSGADFAVRAVGVGAVCGVCFFLVLPAVAD